MFLPAPRSPLFAALFLISTAGCSAFPQPLEPSAAVKVPHEHFVKSIRTLCLQGVKLTAFQAPEHRVSDLESKFTEELQARGYTLIPSDRVTETWNEARPELGDRYNQHTGKRDSASWTRHREATLLALGCDAFIAGEVASVTGSFDGRNIRWDGKNVRLGTGSAQLYGWLGALSFWSTISDAAGVPVYFSTGGIEPRYRFANVFSGKTGPVPEEELLFDAEANLAAIRASLAQLTPRVPPKS
jgi:hypothetical protein